MSAGSRRTLTSAPRCSCPASSCGTAGSPPPSSRSGRRYRGPSSDQGTHSRNSRKPGGAFMSVATVSAALATLRAASGVSPLEGSVPGGSTVRSAAGKKS